MEKFVILNYYNPDGRANGCRQDLIKYLNLGYIIMDKIKIKQGDYELILIHSRSAKIDRINEQKNFK